MNSIIRYFDLQSDNRTTTPKGHASGQLHAPVLPQYAAVTAGVIVEPLLKHYMTNNEWSFDLATFGGRLVFGLIIGLIILPSIYKSAFDPEKPLLIQLAALFPLGIGWQNLFNAATKAVAGQ